MEVRQPFERGSCCSKMEGAMEIRQAFERGCCCSKMEGAFKIKLVVVEV